MIKNIFMTNTWQKTYLNSIKNDVGHRYSPKYNTQLSISNIFNWLTRNQLFYSDLNKDIVKFFKNIDLFENFKSSLLENYDKIENITSDIRELEALLKMIKSYSVDSIDWRNISHFSKKTHEHMTDLRNHFKGIQDENRAMFKKYNDFYNIISEIMHSIKRFIDIDSTEYAKISNTKFLYLVGEAGIGKTHLLCDLLERSNESKNMGNVILALGDKFLTALDPLTNIVNYFCASSKISLSNNNFLKMLDVSGKRKKCKSLIVIDAINETVDKAYWQDKLIELVNKLKCYNNIALVLSVRDIYEDFLILDACKHYFIRKQHFGLAFNQWEAVNKYFKEYNIPIPEVPLINREFQNPLFVRFFCEAYKDRSKKLKNDMSEILRGHEGFNKIFEKYIDGKSHDIHKKYSLIIKKDEDIWNKIIKEMADNMVANIKDYVSYIDVCNIIVTSYPSINPDELLEDLESYLLIVRVLDANGGFNFKFPFQRFSDHIICRYIFKKYDKFCKDNKHSKKDIVVLKHFFSKRKMGKYIVNPNNYGIVEALFIQFPQYYEQEFFKVAAYIKTLPISMNAYIQSFVWRSPKSVSDENVKYIKDKLLKNKILRPKCLDAILSLSVVSDHKLNAKKFMHEYMSKFSMSARDAWWNGFLESQYGNWSTVDRIIEWSFFHVENKNLSDHTLLLMSLTLSWFLTSSNRVIRDKSTKAIVFLLTNKLNVLLDLLNEFVNLDKPLNEPYLIERLYAITYGCLLRTADIKEQLQNILELIKKHMARNYTIFINILLRDHISSIFKLAIDIGIIKFDINTLFHSVFPNSIQSVNYLRKKYKLPQKNKLFPNDSGLINIWISIMHNEDPIPSFGDFGHYVINPVISNWSARRLNSKYANEIEKIEKFILVLNDTQRCIFNDFLEMRQSAHLYKYIDKNESIKILKKSDTKFHLLLNMLSEDKAEWLRKIRAFFKDGFIRDPLEKFDVSRAQRWIFKRVMTLGWSEHLHGQYDMGKNHNFEDRSERDSERIGKKYQWIALYEFLARVSDNFQFKGSYVDGQITKYNNLLQLDYNFIRNIDVSYFQDNFVVNRNMDWPNIDNVKATLKLKKPYNISQDSNFINNKKNLPEIKKIIDIADNNGDWIFMGGSISWRGNILKDELEDQISRQVLDYVIRSYIVKIEQKQNFIKFLKQRGNLNDEVVIFQEFNNLYLGEYPKVCAMHKIYQQMSDWKNLPISESCDISLLATTSILQSNFNRDFSGSQPVNINVPSLALINGMQLNHSDLKGCFLDRANPDQIIAFDPSIIDKSLPQCLLLNKNNLINFLTVNKYAIVWTLYAEKYITSDLSSKRQVINGVYSFDNDNKIKGTRTFKVY